MRVLAANSQMGRALWLIVFCSIAFITKTDESIVSRHTINKNFTDQSMVYFERDVHEPEERYAAFSLTNSANLEILEIEWLNSTADSISIQWGLNKLYNTSGYIRDSVVEYFLEEGRFTSRPLGANVREYTCERLESGKFYTICVYMNEMFGANNSGSSIHSKCVTIKTAHYIRNDTLFILLVTMGYYIFLVLLGYTQWKRKVWTFQARVKKCCEEENQRSSDNKEMSNKSNCQ